MIKYPASAAGYVTRVWEIRGERGDVLLVHDAGLRADWWRRNFVDLGERDLRTVAVDLPGHGFATKGLPAAGIDLSGLSAFAAGIVEGLELTRPAIVGAGLGATVALALATARPDLVGTLTLIAPLGVAPLPAEATSRLAATIGDNDVDTVSGRVRRHTRDPGFSTEDWLADEVSINGSPGSGHSLRAYAALAESLAGGRAATIVPDVPITLFWGGADELMPAELAAATGAALDCDAAVIPGAGHAAYIDAHELIDQTVTDAVLSRSAPP